MEGISKKSGGSCAEEGSAIHGDPFWIERWERNLSF
jgi:hypothetical protein